MEKPLAEGSDPRQMGRPGLPQPLSFPIVFWIGLGKVSRDICSFFLLYFFKLKKKLLPMNSAKACQPVCLAVKY